MIKILIIGLGGFLGTISRYLSQELVNKLFTSQIPLGTLVVNIVGSFLIGVIYALSEKNNLFASELKIFLVYGFCGGFTTFSSFAYENMNLLKEGNYLSFFLYISISIIVGLLAVFSGVYLIKSI